MAARQRGINHVILTVSDLERSTEWYCDLFDLTPVSTEENIGPPHVPGMRYRGLFDLSTFSYVLGLSQHEGGDPAAFDPRRIGLDHAGFGVAERADLDEWIARLDERGIEHGGIVDSAYATVISFRDPDGIALELTHVKVDFWADLIAGLGR